MGIFWTLAWPFKTNFKYGVERIMKQIIAIGGGGFGRQIKDLKIEKYIVNQSKNKNPIIFLFQLQYFLPYPHIRLYELFLVKLYSNAA